MTLSPGRKKKTEGYDDTLEEERTRAETKQHGVAAPSPCRYGLDQRPVRAAFVDVMPEHAAHRARVRPRDTPYSQLGDP